MNGSFVLDSDGSGVQLPIVRSPPNSRSKPPSVRFNRMPTSTTTARKAPALADGVEAVEANPIVMGRAMITKTDGIGPAKALSVYSWIF